MIPSREYTQISGSRSEKYFLSSKLVEYFDN